MGSADGIINTGHDPDNDDLLSTGLTQKERIINGQRTDPQFQYGGYSGQNPTTGEHYGPSGAQDAAHEYRQQGSTSMTREGPQLQYGAANQSLGRAEGSIGAASQGIQDAQTARMAQYGALDSIARAANGQQPSRAEILGKSMIGQSLRAQFGGAASARGGPLAQMAARRQVAQGAAGFQAQGTNQLSALRADEMERARNQWMQGAGAIRGQDYQGSQAQLNQGLAYGQVGGQRAQMAQAQGSMDMSQRGLNQQDRQFFEGLGYQVQNDQANRNLQNEMDRRNAAERHWEVQGGMNQGNRQKETGATLGFAGGILGAISDVRAKQPASIDGGKEKPLLLATGKQPKAANPNWLDGYMDAEAAKDQAKREATEHETRMRETTAKKEDPYEVPDWLKANEAPDLPGGRDDPYAPATRDHGGGLGLTTRQDPYGGQYNPRTQQVDPSTAPVYFGAAPQEEDTRNQGAVALGQGFTNAGKAYGSDDKTKLKAAFQSGVLYSEKGDYRPEVLPEYMRDEKQNAQFKEKAQYDKNLRDAGAREQRGDAPKPQGPVPKVAPTVHPSVPLKTSQLEEDANRKLAGSAWTYKPEYAPQGEEPGQLHYGGMAQNYETNPITKTAVRVDPKTGTRAVDMPSMMMVQGSGIASLQKQVDELKYGGRRG